VKEREESVQDKVKIYCPSAGAIYSSKDQGQERQRNAERLLWVNRDQRHDN